MSALGIDGAVKLIREGQTEIEQQCAEAIELLKQVPLALEHSDRAEASRLLTAATDIAHDLGLEIGELFEELGLEDGAEEHCADIGTDR